MQRAFIVLCWKQNSLFIFKLNLPFFVPTILLYNSKVKCLLSYFAFQNKAYIWDYDNLDETFDPLQRADGNKKEEKKYFRFCESVISSAFGHILLCFIYFHTLIHFLTSIDFNLHKRIGKLWVWNDGQKIDEEVKIQGNSRKGYRRRRCSCLCAEV